MNPMDILIIMAFLVLIGAGYFAGVARVFSAIIGVYFGTVVSATFYQSFGELLAGLVEAMDEGTAEFIAFSLLFLGLTIAISGIVFKTTYPVSMTRRFAMLDSMGGATLSIVVAFVAIALAVAITAIMVQAVSQTAFDSSTASVMSAIEDQLSDSSLAPIFLRLMPYIATAFRPWFPGGLPPILVEAEL